MNAYYNFCVICTSIFMASTVSISTGDTGASIFTFLVFIITGIVLQKRQKNLHKKELDRLELLYTIKNIGER